MGNVGNSLSDSGCTMRSCWHKDLVATAYNLKSFQQKQDEAIAYAKAKNGKVGTWSKDDVHIFSREIGSDGHRYFFCERLDCFYEKYAMMSASDRSIYEVILPDEPCKIHFDLEVSMCLNFGFTPDIQDKLVEKLCSIIREELHILGTK